MITYRKELIQAIERSKSSGLEIPDFFIESNNVSFLNPEIRTHLFEFLYKRVYKNDIDAVAFHCFDWSFYLKNEIDNILCCESILTIGYVDFLGKSAFKSEIEEIVSWISQPSSDIRFGANLHIWLTLPSLEIIDITIAASFLKINSDILGNIKDYRNCVMDLPKENAGIEYFVYRPQFVGEDFLYKTSIAKNYETDENGKPIF